MKLQAQVGDVSETVEIKRDGREVTATIGGREYVLDVSEPQSGVFLIKNGTRIFETAVSEANGHFITTVKGQEFDIKITDPKRLRSAAGDDAELTGKAEIISAMPGKVVRLLVAVGDVVAKGDGVIVVEAMKMQNEMKAPKDGTVTAIKTAEGDTVAAGDVLLVIE